MKSRNRWMIPLFLLLCLWGGPTAAESLSLFSAGPSTTQLTAQQRQRYASYSSLSSTTRIRTMDLISEPSRSTVLQFDLFPGSSYEAVLHKLEQQADGGYTWEGTIEGRLGRVLLAVKGQQITGWIWASRGSEGEEFFSISSLGEGTHVLRETNQDWFDSIYPGCNTGIGEPPAFALVGSEEASEAQEQIAEFAATPTCRVNVLVAYTSAAQAAHGNIPGLAQLAVSQTNVTYANSKVTGLALNLVGTLAVSYVESGSLTGGNSTDLVRLQNPSDGWMDQVHTARTEMGADIVVLLVNNLDSLGIFGQASQILATPGTAFAVVDWEAAVDNLTFAHELGHLQGARHHLEADTSLTPYAHGHGSCRDWPYKYKTVMGTADCAHPRVPHWSNPDVTYNNRSTGDRTRRNNARVLRETACTVSGLSAPALMGWNPRWGNGGSHTVDWWYINTNDRYVGGNFDGDGADELLAVNPNGYAHLMKFNGSSWNTRWANVGNGSIHWWRIGGADRFVAGDFLLGNGRDELLAINPTNGYAHLMVYDGTTWTTPWANVGSGSIDWWYIGRADSYVAGDLLPGNGRDELLAVNPSTGYAHLMTFDGKAWGTPWANVGNRAIHWWLIGKGDSYVAGDFSGNGRDQLLAVNPNGYAHLMTFGSTAWTTKWANTGNKSIHWWSIGSVDRYIAGDFLPGNGRDEVLAVAPNNGWSQILSYTGSAWQTIWGNRGAGNLGWWLISERDIYLAGDFAVGDQRDELLSIQLENGWVHVNSRN